MKPAKKTAALILGIILAALLFFLMSCSPAKRLSNLITKHPELINEKIDTVFKDRLIIEEIPLYVKSDTIRFDSLLIEFNSIRELYYQMTAKGFLNEKNQFEVDQIKYKLEVIKKALRQGALLNTEGHFTTEDSTLSFDYTFKDSKFYLSNVKGKDREITKEKFVQVFQKPTTWQAIKKLWPVWLLIVGAAIVKIILR